MVDNNGIIIEHAMRCDPWNVYVYNTIAKALQVKYPRPGTKLSCKISNYGESESDINDILIEIDTIQ